MIDLKDKKDCCGCSACVQKCPKQCISLKEDNEGFLYPVVDKENCIDCGLCEKVCPVLHQNEPRKPLIVFAAINKNEEIRRESSSGGIFTLIAEKIIDEGGVVFGARFDKNWEVKHDYTETIEGLAPFRGSKYVQSRIENNFKKAEIFLKQGRKVLFSGTPCQIAGLKRFLRKDYDNLLTIDVICHGVPSPGVWRKYLSEIICAKRDDGKNLFSLSLNEMPLIKDISFRDKTNGWKKFGFKIHYVTSAATQNMVSKSTIEDASILEFYRKNVYMKAFLKDIVLRPSCYTCPSREGKCYSDLTIGDFWSIDLYCQEMNDDKGVSLLLVNSNKGMSIIQYLDFINKREIKDYNIYKNFALVSSVKLPKERILFYNDLYKMKSVIECLNIHTYENLINRFKLLLTKIKRRIR